ncbi:MAG: ABC transporter ATP-binding protein [Planctomycetaceae bacterium]|jgi:ATP-binding cassette, subfamily B, bacterial MsbA|nr:ABC transporter ATP-binding protein [Planctomycetaceae bacterium]
MNAKRKGKISEFTRVIPYVWPYRKRLFLSAFFALCVGLFWGLNLTAVYPLMEVLLKGRNFDEYVTEHIDKTELEVEQLQRTSDNQKKQLAALKDPNTTQLESQRIDLMNSIAKSQSKISSASRKVTVMSWLKQHIVRHLPHDPFDLMVLILGALLVATLLKGLFIYFQDVLTGSVVELSILSIRKDCFRRVLNYDFQTIRNVGGTPGLMSRFTFDLNMLSNGLQLIGGRFLREPLKAMTCITLAFMVNWRLTLLSMVFTPLAGYIFYRFGRSLKKASHRMMESMSRICKSMEESFDSIKAVTAYGRARHHRSQFHRENKQYFKKAMKIVRINAMTNPTIEFFGLMAIFTSLLPGAYLVLRQTDEIWNIKLSDSVMDISQLGLMYVLLLGILDPIRKLSKVFTSFKRSAAAAERVFGLIDTEPLVKEFSNTEDLPRLQSCVEFKNITFSYSNNEEDDQAIRETVLNDVSLKIPHGETVVVVGENGSGKSTLVNLLPRFYDPQSGSVTIDGHNIRKASWSSLRSQMAIVTQETLLFDTNIYENIAYGDPNATKEQIVDAARVANVLQFVEKMPDGLDTEVGEKGSKMSGGQRQRIALARAIVRDPAIMILDEATSAIDSQSEKLIHETLSKFLVGRTSFIITHSVTPSILEFTSRIIVMDHGRLVDHGSHEKLIQSCSQYQRLFHAQGNSKAA